METTSSQRSAEASARNLPGKRGLGVALLAAGLAVAPILARPAMAQRPATIQASAYVIDSYIATRFLADSATVAPAAVRSSPQPASAAAVRTDPQPASRQLWIAGLGVVSVQSGSRTEVQVASRFADARGGTGTTVQVSVTYLGN